MYYKIMRLLLDELKEIANDLALEDVGRIDLLEHIELLLLHIVQTDEVVRHYLADYLKSEHLLGHSMYGISIDNWRTPIVDE